MNPALRQNASICGMAGKAEKKGFTLIEMMIVVAVIGVLAAISVPKFSELIDKSREGATKGSLSAIRSALHIYYAGNEGRFPTSDTDLGTLGCLTQSSKYLREIPAAKLPRTGVAESRTVKGVIADAIAQPDDAGGWFYYDDEADNGTWGGVVVNCTREDIRNAYLTSASVPGHTYTSWSTF